MLLSIISALGGGLLRMLPELFAFLNKKADNAHELAMMDKQFELERLRGANRYAEVDLQTNSEQMVHLLDAQAEALRGQMQKTGVWWVDAANFLVRPLTTYYMLALYGLSKIATLVIAVQGGVPMWEALVHIYGDDDFALLSGILGFWFVSRTIEKRGR